MTPREIDFRRSIFRPLVDVATLKDPCPILSNSEVSKYTPRAPSFALDSEEDYAVVVSVK